MKIRFLFFVLAFALAPLNGFAQSQIDADEILALIDQGKPVFFENAIITGTLDFSLLKERTLKRETRGFWDIFIRRDRIYETHIRTSVTFINCIFEDDVLGYLYSDRHKELYNAIFHDDVKFTGCEFKGNTHFKYTQFRGKADFSATAHHGEALFKYTEFSLPADFSDAVFYRGANFKYVKFPGPALFEGAKFSGTAIFKYARFPETADFSGSVFDEDADFKYAKFAGDANYRNASFWGYADFKYAKFREEPDFHDAEFAGRTNFKYSRTR